jgi:hypothetical protein
MTKPREVETVQRRIAASPGAVFALLADPRRHRDIDGSGSVIEAADDVGDLQDGNPDRLSLGAYFGMSMKKGLRYSMVNEVVEFEENRRIAWQTRPPNPWVGRILGGRIWRYELELVDGATLVRESWDISQERAKTAVRVLRKETVRSMERTLARIEELVTA